jgi:hypothetical protein
LRNSTILVVLFEEEEIVQYQGYSRDVYFQNINVTDNVEVFHLLRQSSSLIKLRAAALAFF